MVVEGGLQLIKYTLFCYPGKNFMIGTHILQVGIWLDMQPGRVILAHGLMTESMLETIRINKAVSVFKDNRYHTLSIESNYNEAYQKRLGQLEFSQQYCGKLLQASWNDNIYYGGLDI